MSLPTRATARTATPPYSHLQDETFLAKLGIISVQSRIADDHPENKKWKSEFQIGEAVYSVEGLAGDYGRPRGVDTDIFLALQTLYMLSDCPEDRMVSTTPYELIKMVWGRPSAALYERTRESLRRLWRVGFVINHAHVAPGSEWTNWMQVTLNLIEHVQWWGTGKDLRSAQLNPHQRLKIRFSEPIANSIRAGHTHQLDWQLHSALEQPVARGLYRLLEAHRPAHDHTLIVGLADWTALCGILTDRPDKIRRILASGHEELCDKEFLSGVEFVGRGKNQALHYVYRNLGEADPQHVTMICELGIARDRAEQLARQYRERVEDAVKYVRALCQERRESHNPIRNPSGYLIAVLSNPGEYNLELREGMLLHDPQRIIEMERAKTARIEDAESAAFEQKRAQLKDADSRSKWEQLQHGIKVMAGKHLSEQGFRALERDCLSGRIGADEVNDELVRLLASSGKDRKAYLSRWEEVKQPVLLT